MSSEYEKILNMVNKLNKIEGEKCMICHFPDKEENLLKLSCNHFFHSKCLCFDTTKSSINCPYCDKRTSLKYIFDIQRTQENNLCLEKLKNGINKGKTCGRKNCKYHKTTDLSPCNVILKTGSRKGEVCNRINCR